MCMCARFWLVCVCSRGCYRRWSSSRMEYGKIRTSTINSAQHVVRWWNDNMYIIMEYMLWEGQLHVCLYIISHHATAYYKKQTLAFLCALFRCSAHISAFCTRPINVLRDYATMLIPNGHTPHNLQSQQMLVLLPRNSGSQTTAEKWNHPVKHTETLKGGWRAVLSTENIISIMRRVSRGCRTGTY